ncbi:Segmentation protein Runt [Eumeta japonica]|uniref:Segmentation protein Runt n=1 Tax=Eumeta variegata TaxID=151549 RepID=A0A4C2A5E2_EUMVA|nr:Segmentation protein Runt [Eumeta japonica]
MTEIISAVFVCVSLTLTFRSRPLCRSRLVPDTSFDSVSAQNFKLDPDYGYGHPGAFSPFLLNAGWLDAAYLNYAWADYFRPAQLREQGAALVKVLAPARRITPYLRPRSDRPLAFKAAMQAHCGSCTKSATEMKRCTSDSFDSISRCDRALHRYEVCISNARPLLPTKRKETRLFELGPGVCSPARHRVRINKYCTLALRATHAQERRAAGVPRGAAACGATPITAPVIPGADLFPFPAAVTNMPPGGLLPPPGTFLPPNGLLPFPPHPAELTLKSLPPELALKNGMNPYDALASMRNLQSSVSSLDASSVRMSPTSSRHSSSPHSAPNVSPNRSKADSKSDAHSTRDTDESDEEPIEVVKSAFHPARPANLELQEMKRVQAADSTVADRPRPKQDLKAPSRTSTRLEAHGVSQKLASPKCEMSLVLPHANALALYLPTTSGAGGVGQNQSVF